MLALPSDLFHTASLFCLECLSADTPTNQVNRHDYQDAIYSKLPANKVNRSIEVSTDGYL